MKLYQLGRKAFAVVSFMILILLAGGCGQIQPAPSTVFLVTITAQGETKKIEISAGTTAREALDQAGVEISSLDKSTPPLYTVLQEGDEVVFIQVEEEYVVEEEVIPYDTQLLRNESLAEGERRLIQPGENGMVEQTYRILFEDGLEVSRSLSSSIVISDPVPEIVMVGSQSPFTVLPIPGILAYISAGNAWVMRDNTGLRQPIVTTGDLDGRVFTISNDGRWLLFTRSSEEENTVNSLWVAEIESGGEKLFELGVDNIIHFADWTPGTTTGIGFSTAEFNPSPPGWQANNDLQFVNFSEDSGWTTSAREKVEQNLGGLYGWWGTEFLYSPDGSKMAYARPDGVGLVDLDYGLVNELAAALPVQTRSDWAWVPAIAWAPESDYLYFVDHIETEGLSAGEDSQVFDLAIYPFRGGAPVAVVSDVGMFGYPKPSPMITLDSGERTYQVAFLKAIEPRQSRTSLYQLMLMDQDGSNLRRIFPDSSSQGLTPHNFYWLPWYSVEDYPLYLTLIYQGDLWLVDMETGEAQQLTGDGLVTALDWN